MVLCMNLMKIPANMAILALFPVVMFFILASMAQAETISLHAANTTQAAATANVQSVNVQENVPPAPGAGIVAMVYSNLMWLLIAVFALMMMLLYGKKPVGSAHPTINMK